MTALAIAVLVIALGDSVTCGVRPDGSVTAEQTFVHLLESRLRRQDANVRLVNAGVPGNNTRDLLARLERDVLSRRPELVLVMAGINDSAYVDAGPRVRTTPRVPLPEFRDNLREIVLRARGAGASILLLTPNPISRRYVYSNLGFYRDHDMNDALRLYAAAVSETGAGLHEAVVDVFNDWLSTRNFDRLLVDGIHPNARGHRRIARLAAPVCERLLERITAR